MCNLGHSYVAVQIDLALVLSDLRGIDTSILENRRIYYRDLAIDFLRKTILYHVMRPCSRNATYLSSLLYFLYPCKVRANILIHRMDQTLKDYKAAQSQAPIILTLSLVIKVPTSLVPSSASSSVTAKATSATSASASSASASASSGSSSSGTAVSITSSSSAYRTTRLESRCDGVSAYPSYSYCLRYTKVIKSNISLSGCQRTSLP